MCEGGQDGGQLGAVVAPAVGPSQISPDDLDTGTDLAKRHRAPIRAAVVHEHHVELYAVRAQGGHVGGDVVALRLACLWLEVTYVDTPARGRRQGRAQIADQRGRQYRRVDRARPEHHLIGVADHRAEAVGRLDTGRVQGHAVDTHG